MVWKKCRRCCGLNAKPKNIYPTISDALEAIRYLQSQNNRLKLKYYKCPAGNGYHLTEDM